MLVTVENIGSYIGMMVFVGAIIQFMVVMPINKSLEKLEVTIRNLQMDIKDLSAIMNEHRERIAIVEQKTDALHCRIDRCENDKHGK